MSESTVERNILTIIEPAILLDPLEILDVESGSENSEGATLKEKPSKFSQVVPVIRVNGYDVQKMMHFIQQLKYSLLMLMDFSHQDFIQKMEI